MQMKISKLPHDFKRTPRFTRPPHIKTDTHYIFTTPKYVAEVVYHSSMFYAPEFYKVTVRSVDGKQIWSSGDAIFLDTLFSSDFISDEFDRMILTRVNSTESSNHSQIVLIDLKTGNKEVLTEEGAYYSAGNFVSFDGIYYSDSRAIHCVDYSNNHSFILSEVLQKYFAQIKTWGTCFVKDCILVVTTDKENNVCLFNLRQQKITDRSNLCWQDADAVSISISTGTNKEETILSVSYADRQASGALKHRGTEYFKLEF